LRTCPEPPDDAWGYRTAACVLHGIGQEGTTMPVEFDEDTGTLLDGKNSANRRRTLNQDGSPHTSVVWDHQGRKHRAVHHHRGKQERAKPRSGTRGSASPSSDAQDPYHSVDIRGATELTENRDKSLPRRLSHKYLAEDPPADPEHVVRLTVRVTPQKVTGFSFSRESGGWPGRSVII